MVAMTVQLSVQEHSNTFWFKFVLSAMSATVAEVVTYPLDLTKTRLQIQGETGGKQCSVPYRGAVSTAVGIIKEEGLSRLWLGVTPAIYRHVIYTGLRMVCYEQMREHRLGKNPDGSFPLWKAVVGGLSAGGFAQFCASPADLVKVQMQMEGRRRLEGKPPRVKSAAHAFRTILANGGVRSLWKGCIPNVQRSALVNLGDLTTYDSCKRFFITHTQLKDNSLTHFLSSALSGLVGAVMGTPADVIKARIMNQPTDAHGRGTVYKNSIDCLKKTVQGEGFWALYKGFIPAWCRMAPWSLTFWMCYENIRKVAGVASF